jgi:hypothetical protein
MLDDGRVQFGAKFRAKALAVDPDHVGAEIRSAGEREHYRMPGKKQTFVRLSHAASARKIVHEHVRCSLADPASDALVSQQARMLPFIHALTPSGIA